MTTIESNPWMIAYHAATTVAALCAAAEAAFDTYRATDNATRSAFLEAIADEIEVICDVLIETAMRESSLPRVRLEGGRGRTTGQLRMFARFVRKGRHERVRHDPALPDRTPLPRPEVRVKMIALGPVAVFGASNFPLAFSTAAATLHRRSRPMWPTRY